MKIYGDGLSRGEDDGYRCELVAGLRSSEDARRLVAEVGFAVARLHEMATEKPGLWGTAVRLAQSGDLEQATWVCFVVAYLSPLDGGDPFAAARRVLAAVVPEPVRADAGVGPAQAEAGSGLARPGVGSGLARPGVGSGLARPGVGSGPGWAGAEVDPGGLEEADLGRRSSHELERGAATLQAYLDWAGRATSQADAIRGDDAWSAERRFERIFERLALPGLARGAKFEFLVSIGQLGLYQMRADSLHLAAADADDPALVGAKRVFGIGDAINLERRAARFADASEVPLEAVELGMFNWASGRRAALGVPTEVDDEGARGRIEDALEL